MKIWALPRLASLVLVLTAPSCGSDDPARTGRPPVVESYRPEARDLSFAIGDTVAFRLDVLDPDDDDLEVRFLMDGVRVGVGDRWSHVVEDTGRVTVRGEATDGEFSSYIEWKLDRFQPVNLPPLLTAAQPLESNPIIVIGTEIDFAVLASDPEHDPLSYSFTVDDTVVAGDRQFRYRPAATGVKAVRAVVSDGLHFATREWALKVTEVPDTIAPARVPMLSAVIGKDPGEVDLEWIAVGRDGMTGLPSQYFVRTSPEPIASESDWSRASERPGVPSPAPPGETMGMVVTGLQPARFTYLTVRAVDDFGNVSPIGESLNAVTRGMRITGRVVNAVTGQGVEGVEVSLKPFVTLTDAAGEWTLAELPPLDATLAAREEATADIGAFFDMSMTYSVRHLDRVDLFLIPNTPLVTTMYTDLQQFFRSMTDIAGHPFGSRQRRWQLPINLYVRPFTREGLDYKATIERVAREFDSLLGTQVFNIVETRPSTGVETMYIDGLARDNYGVTEWTSDWYPRLGLIEFRQSYLPHTEHVLEITARHELGHTLGLNHSTDDIHIMVGGPAPQVPTFGVDELLVMRCHYTIPRGWDNTRFLRN